MANVAVITSTNHPDIANPVNEPIYIGYHNNNHYTSLVVRSGGSGSGVSESVLPSVLNSEELSDHTGIYSILYNFPI